jgi:hypothetical protein
MHKRWSTTFVKAALAVVAVTVLAGHVAPSVDDNNRYVKVTPLGDGVRLAYTVFFGEIPGATERKQLDANHDGRIDDAERRRYGDKLAAEVLAALDVDLDGKSQKFTWQIVDVGLGSDAVAAGSFSVDLVTYLCGTPGTKHTIRLRDQFRIPRPGETEVKVEDSPGVTVTRARVGPADDPTHDYRFVGPGGPLSDDGLEVEWTAGPTSERVPNATCGKAVSAKSGRTPWVLIGIGALVVIAGGALVIARKLKAS